MINSSRILYAVCLLLLLSSCTRAYYQPNRADWEYFEKAGASKEERMKAVLECNDDTPPVPKFGTLEDNIRSVQKHKCLAKAGFYPYTGYQICDHNDIMQTVPLCSQPLSAAPDRDVNLRLNSRFCRNYPKYLGCKP